MGDFNEKNMGKKIIIGLVGKIAAGKGTVADYFVNKYKAEVFSFSQSLRDILERMHAEISRANMQKLSTALRQNFGEDLLAKIMAGDVESTSNKVIIVDGIRRMADIAYLQNFSNFIMVSVETDIKKRYERLIKRTQNNDDTKKTYEQFLIDEKAETEKEIPLVMENSQEKIDNNGDLKNLEEQLEKIIKKYGK